MGAAIFYCHFGRWAKVASDYRPGMHPNSKKNLEMGLEAGKETRFKSGAEVAETGRRGGIASGQRRKRDKTMQEMALQILKTKVIDPDLARKLAEMGLDTTYNAAILESMTSKAVKGSEKAAAFVRDTSGQAPKQTVNLVTNDNLSRDEIRAMSDEELAALLELPDEDAE